MIQKRFRQKGLTLVELMISLALGLVISAAVIQILVSNSVTDSLNRAIASTQENGRYLMSRLRQDLMMVGFYDSLDPNLSTFVDITEEEAFVRARPVLLPGDFVAAALMGSEEGGAATSNDTLMVGFQGARDCRGLKLGYAADEEFYVVNQYFVEDNKLKCRGADGRVLRGQKAAVGDSGGAAMTLLDEVYGFQVLYGITDPTAPGNRGTPARYIDASNLEAAYDANSQVVAIRLAFLVKGEGEATISEAASFKLLDEAAFTVSDKGLYKAFETTITLRNMKNFSRGSVI
uniref:PilW family protein n=1 Tax=Ningiella ruwaisensis TaxID=2364274 RepID=UPI0010A02643|nr:PilW family protein [Ningiella ruwaisensis]